MTLVLDSPGGEMAPAKMIADLMDFLADRGIVTRTHIEPGARCLSACVLIYASGAQRTAAASASIGLHAVRDAEGRIDSQAGRRMAGFLGSRGVARNWLAKLTEEGVFESRTMTAFTGNDLLSSGLAHSLYN